MNSAPIDRATQIARFTNLLRVLTEVEERKLPFDMTTWKTSPSCTSAGCAIGWAFSDPWFRAQGAGLGENSVGRLFPTIDGEPNAKLQHAFFGLTWTQFDYLFMPDSYWPELRAIEDEDELDDMSYAEHLITPAMVKDHIDFICCDLGIHYSEIEGEAP